MDNQLREWMQENLSPQAVAVMANALKSVPDTPVYAEVYWFREQLMAIAGGEESVASLCAEIGDE
jgi:hypothetical protein